MRLFRRFIYSGIIIGAANLFVLLALLMTAGMPAIGLGILTALLFLLLLFILIVPQKNSQPTKVLRALANGCELLRLFLISAAVTLALQLIFLIGAYQEAGPEMGIWYLAYAAQSIFLALLCEAAVFWSGMLRLYTMSVQLGIRHRVLALLLAWVPGFNLYYLLKMIRIAEAEIAIEAEKAERNNRRAASEICRTKYPLLLVHGVFFRDFRYLNYWGRVPGELIKNGATIYYGNQQSAASVDCCGAELAERIRQIVQETGCGKVNIIAHSKGGLDSRAAISRFGAAPYVASLTTINTPHRGCIFAEYLIGRCPNGLKQAMAASYNRVLKQLGDRTPDFLAAVGDLTASACAERNKITPDMPGILYESVGSYCRKATGGRFPLNVSYPVVRHFDGKNDGLVAIDSAPWGERFTLLEPGSRRGISHGDMIDLNRENIPGFDVREFYVSLAAGLKDRGY